MRPIPSSPTPARAPRPTLRASPGGLLELQRTAGNRAVSSLVAALGPTVQRGEGPVGIGLQSPHFAGVRRCEDALAGTRLLTRWQTDGDATRALQETLAAIGFDPGPVDGLWGPRTDGAVRRFQVAQGLSADGLIGPKTMKALDQADLTRASGGQPVRTPDPRLGHNAPPTGPDPENPGPTTRLPYRGVDAGSDWDGAAVLARWTQLDGDPNTHSDPFRCAANAALAPRILAGMPPTSDYGEALREEGIRKAADPMFASKKDDMVKAGAQASIAAANLRLAFGTYGDLSRIADAGKRIVTENPLGSSSAVEAGRLNTVASTGRQDVDSARPRSIEQVYELCAMLRPGQAWTVLIDLEDVEATDPSQTDHVITVGCFPNKLPEERDAIYLYDPFPRTGSQLVLKDSQIDLFRSYFERSMGQGMKMALFVLRTEPRSTAER